MGYFDPETKKVVKPVDSGEDDDREYECPKEDCTLVTEREIEMVVHLEYDHEYSREEARRIVDERF